jgi:signal transduction histidine kinase
LTLPADFDVQLVAVLIIGAAWLLFAVWAVIRSARVGAQAQMAQKWGLRLRGLLAAAPGAYLIVGQGNQVTVSEKLRSWLGLAETVHRLGELAPKAGGGFSGEDFTELEGAILATSVSGVPFSLTLRAEAQNRLLRAEGSSAAEDVAGANGVVVWFSDLTDTETRVSDLEAARAADVDALEALQSVIARAPLPVWRRDQKLNLIAVNTAYVEAVDASSEADVLDRGVELVGSSAVTAPLQAARQVLETGKPLFREETAIIGGERKLMRIAETCISNGQIAGLAIDISELAGLRAKEVRVKAAQAALFERLSAGVARFGPDRILVDANLAFRRLFQLSEAFLEDRPEFDRVVEAMRDNRKIPEQRDFPGWRKARSNWFVSADDSIEETWVLPDNMVVRVIALPEPDGGLVLIFEDQSERLRLASSRDQLMRVQGVTLHHLREGVSVFSAAGQLQFHNDAFARLMGLPDTLLDEPTRIEPLFLHSQTAARPEELAQLMVSLIRSVTEGGGERNGRLVLSQDRYVRYSAVPLPDGNALLTFDDITDAERVERALRDRAEALETADRAKSTFVENMSYELRTPLTAIAGFGEMLATGLAGEISERQADYVSSILTSAGRLQAMIDSIIDLAASDVGNLTLESETVEAKVLAAEATAFVESAATDRDISLSFNTDGTVGDVDCDRVRVRQALYNLLDNAVRFTPVGGTVSMTLRSDREMVVFEVCDNGFGIPENERGNVFERFFKASNAEHTSGVGLGLSLVKEVAELHGGSILLSPQSGGGTCARLALPCKAAVPLADLQEESVAAGGVPTITKDPPAR